MTDNIKVTYALRYSQVMKQWLILTANEKGVVIDTHRGGTKQGAMMIILKRINPELHGEIVNIIHNEIIHKGKISTQLIKAAQLIIKGRVYIGKVQSQSTDRIFYHVSHEGQPKAYKCNCQHFVKGGVFSWSYGPMCKHTWAMHLAWLLEMKLTEAPIKIYVS